ncbi:MAG: acyl-CoA dehydrogenase family protein [Planctomycetota bacterium]
MPHDLTPEQREWREAAERFAQKALIGRDQVAADRDGRFDREGWRACADFGVHGMPLPEEHGGLGLSLSHLIAVMEGLGFVALDQGLLFSINAHLWTNSLPLLHYGTDEQRERWLPGLCDGSLIGANAASEPDAGSDVFGMQTRAVRDGGDYVLNGAKTFVTNGPVADLFVSYATLDPALGPMGITGFVIERGTPGLSVGGKIEKMGLRTSPMSEVVFEDCRVPAANRLGREGRGVEVFESSMEWERGCILACCLGAMRRLLEGSITHARNRKQFGQPIGKFQSVANRIVDMKVRLETARPLVYAVGAKKDRGEPAMLEAALAKLYVAESYVESCRDALQVYGGYGYMTEQEIERDLRDALSSTLYSGTSEIQRNLIARGLGL